MHNRYVHILESGESMVSNTVIASIIFSTHCLDPGPNYRTRLFP